MNTALHTLKCEKVRDERDDRDHLLFLSLFFFLLFSSPGELPNSFLFASSADELGSSTVLFGFPHPRMMIIAMIGIISYFPEGGWCQTKSYQLYTVLSIKTVDSSTLSDHASV